MSEPLRIDGATLHLGDCLEVLRTLPDESADAVVCDPPYELGFMGKRWDSTGIAFKPETWADVLRALKPGGHLLAAGGTRTYHRMTCAIEDAGFEIRDCLAWHYGTGFPKSLNVGKGRGTALKPAFEPFVLARKPLIGTVVENVLAHGTGALNVDACRIATTDTLNGGAYSGGERPNSAMGCTGEVGGTSSMLEAGGGRLDPSAFKQPKGRWPANVIFSHLPDCTDAACAPGCAVAELDAQSGVLTSGLMRAGTPRGPQGEVYHKGFSGQPMAQDTYADSGGASRFFYCAKPSGEERDGNAHPTVKPVALMRWFCRLVTPPGGIVLDPFMGSGTTGVACAAEGFRFVGVEREPAYFAIAERRIREATAQGSLFAPSAIAGARP